MLAVGRHVTVSSSTNDILTSFSAHSFLLCNLWASLVCPLPSDKFRVKSKAVPVLKKINPRTVKACGGMDVQI
jgi:hypothetical protein